MQAKQSTITVPVKFMGDLPAVIGQRDILVTLPEGNTVGDLLAALSESYGDAFTCRVFSAPAKLHHYMLVFVNGENITDCGGFDERLGGGKVEVIMMPMFGGG